MRAHSHIFSTARVLQLFNNFYVSTFACVGGTQVFLCLFSLFLRFQRRCQKMGDLMCAESFFYVSVSLSYCFFVLFLLYLFLCLSVSLSLSFLSFCFLSLSFLSFCFFVLLFLCSVSYISVYSSFCFLSLSFI